MPDYEFTKPRPERIQHPELLPGLDAHSIKLFWALVDVRGPNDCWLWKGRKNTGAKGKGGGGYGVWTTSYKIHKRNRRTWLTHVLAYTIAFGPPKNKVCHNCPGRDQRACCNPEHLWDGTQAENMADAARKGTISQGDRHFSKVHPEWVPRGDRQPRTKIPDAEISLIFKLRGDGRDVQYIADLFSVKREAIWRILRGVRRQYVSKQLHTIDI